jgi:hypothetical protein
MRTVKIIVEEHADGYTGYPVGFTRGAIVGYGSTYEEAVQDTESAIAFFIEHYGAERFFDHIEQDSPLENAYIAEVRVPS